MADIKMNFFQNDRRDKTHARGGGTTFNGAFRESFPIVHIRIPI